MPCFHPLRGTRLPNGKIKWRSKKYQWGGEAPVTVGCGQCTGCRLERSRQWAVRMTHESQLHERNCFITLTYDQVNLPEDMSLDVKHWQDFAKRLRHKIGKFRFYHCGEYGDDNGRPHYHGIIFGEDFSFDRKFLKNSAPTNHFSTSGEHPLFTSKTLEETWGKGFCYIGSMTFESAAYIARYCCKKVTGKKADAHYNGLKPEYATMSRNPGIASGWLDKYITDVYPSDEVIINAQRSHPPRYYDNQLDKRNPDLLTKIKSRRVIDAEQYAENNTPERLKVRETIQNKRMSMFKRDKT